MNCYFTDEEIVGLYHWWSLAHGCAPDDEVTRAISRKLEKYASLAVSNEQQRRWRQAERESVEFG